MPSEEALHRSVLRLPLLIVQETEARDHIGRQIVDQDRDHSGSVDAVEHVPGLVDDREKGADHQRDSPDVAECLSPQNQQRCRPPTMKLAVGGGHRSPSAAKEGVKAFDFPTTGPRPRISSNRAPGESSSSPRLTNRALGRAAGDTEPLLGCRR